MTVQVHRAKQCRPRKGGFLRRSPTFSSTSVFLGHLVLHNMTMKIYHINVPKGFHQFIIFQPVQIETYKMTIQGCDSNISNGQVSLAENDLAREAQRHSLEFYQANIFV